MQEGFDIQELAARREKSQKRYEEIREIRSGESVEEGQDEDSQVTQVTSIKIKFEFFKSLKNSGFITVEGRWNLSKDIHALLDNGNNLSASERKELEELARELDSMDKELTENPMREIKWAD